MGVFFFLLASTLIAQPRHTQTLTLNRPARFVHQVRGDGAIDDTQHSGHVFRFTGKQKAQRERHTKHPFGAWADEAVSHPPTGLHCPPFCAHYNSGKSRDACN